MHNRFTLIIENIVMQSVSSQHFLQSLTLSHILYLLVFLINRGVEKLSGVTLGLGRGVLGVSGGADTVDAFLMASGKSSGRLACDDDAVNRFSDIVFNIFFPASLVYNKNKI